MARQQRWEGEEVGAVLSRLNQVPAAACEVDTAPDSAAPGEPSMPCSLKRALCT